MRDTTRRFDGPFAWAQDIAGWVLLALCLFSVIAYGANTPIAWILLTVLVSMIFALQIVLHCLRPSANALNHAVLPGALYLTVLIWGAVQITLPVPPGIAHHAWAFAPTGAVPRIGADPDNGHHMLMRLATYGMIAWIAAASSLNSSRAWAYVRGVALFSSALAAYGLYAGLTGVNPVLGLDGPPTAVSATFVNRNSYATYAAFGLFANVVVYLKQAGRGGTQDERVALRNFLEDFFAGAWLYAMGGLLCGAAVVLTASRAGGVATIFGLIALFVSLLLRRRGSSFVLWGVIFLIGGFVAFALGSNLINRFLTTSGEELRFVIYPALVQQILTDRPWLGQGIGAFQDTFRAHLPPQTANVEWDMAHNSYLENFYELGIPAAALLYLALGLIVLRLVNGVQTRETDLGLPAFALAAVVTGAFHSVLDFSLQMPACAALFAVILGIGWSQSFRYLDRSSQTVAQAQNNL